MQGNGGGRDPFFEFATNNMQGNGSGRNPFLAFSDPLNGFGGFGGFGGHRSLFSNFFGGRDPFDDPFFTHPFGGISPSGLLGPSRTPFPDMHGSGFFEHQIPQPRNSRGPIIEELNSDDDGEKEEEHKVKKENSRKHGRSSTEPYVVDPDDEADERKSKQMLYINDFNRMNNTRAQPQSHSVTFQSSTVTYGGANGAYYTSSRARRTGSDGLTIEETKEADTASGKAAHRLSRGIHNKGHSVSRKLNPDGRVDTMQTLHNLNEDELASFEESWKVNARNRLPGWSEGLNGQGSGISLQNGAANRGGWALPAIEGSQQPGMMGPDFRDGAGASSARPQHSGVARSAVGDRTGSSRGRARAPGTSNMGHARKQ